MSRLETILQSALSISVVVLTACSAEARTLHVPTPSYPTVQAGLDSLSDGDTVSVTLGLYSESLHSPPIHFVLKGDVTPDTGDYPRPIIDPSSIPGSDTLGCLIIPQGGHPIIEDFRFRNGSRMYPRIRVGGVSCGGPEATFNRCIFDSTDIGILVTNNCTVEIAESRFLNVQDGGIYSYYYDPVVHASDCVFSGCYANQIRATGGCNITRCNFGSYNGGYECASGRGVSITNCQFGPNSPGQLPESSPVELDHPVGVIEDNVFTGLALDASSDLLRLICANNDTNSVGVGRNKFLNNIAPSGTGFLGVSIQSTGGFFCRCAVRVDSNLFDNNHTFYAPLYRGIGIDGAAITARGNIFHNLTWDRIFGSSGPPPVIASHHALSSLLRSNRFDSVGLAVLDNYEGDVDSVDARWNWWGDSTGPYNYFMNPTGLGDTVVGCVQISPWCTDTIICEEPNAAKDRPFILHPSSFRLSSYPNPFNSTTTLRLEVPEAEIVRIELFDILGRRVRELWSGAVSNEKEITFDGSALASGVCFVRATSTTWNRPLVSAKIVLLK